MIFFFVNMTVWCDESLWCIIKKEIKKSLIYFAKKSLNSLLDMGRCKHVQILNMASSMIPGISAHLNSLNERKAKLSFCSCRTTSYEFSVMAFSMMSLKIGLIYDAVFEWYEEKLQSSSIHHYLYKFTSIIQSLHACACNRKFKRVNIEYSLCCKANDCTIIKLFSKRLVALLNLYGIPSNLNKTLFNY
jgi:hypothetical protein